MRATRHFVPVSSWKDRRQIRGVWGERIAMAYLTSCGWHIEAHRFRLGRQEIDVVARRGNLVAFVEVKTRRSLACGQAIESVNPLKQRLVARAASLWRLRRGRPEDEYRFDLVAVHAGSFGGYEVEHVEDAWRLDGSLCWLSW